MAYLHCPSCRRTAWLHSTAEPGLCCDECQAAMIPMPDRQARFLTRAVRARFDRDARLGAGRKRFVRDSGPHGLAE